MAVAWVTLSVIKALRPVTPAMTAASEQERLAHTFGARVRAVREQRGWSQADLAARMRRTPAYVERLELGGVEPRLETLLLVSRALDAEIVLDLRPRVVA